MIGTVVSHYNILEHLGGGIRVIYRAEDTRLKCTVALTFLLPSLSTDPEAKEGSLDEAETTPALDYPNKGATL